MSDKRRPTTPKKILFVNTKAPYGSSMARDALDALLAASAYEQDLSVLFLGEAVFQLLTHQNPKDIGMKSLGATLPVLPMYDIEKIFIQESALLARGLTADDLVLPATVLGEDAIAALMGSQEAILSF